MNNRVAEEFLSIDFPFDPRVHGSAKGIFTSPNKREALAASSSFFFFSHRNSDAEQSRPENLVHDKLLAQSDMISMSSLFITSFLLHQEEANVNY